MLVEKRFNEQFLVEPRTHRNNANSTPNNFEQKSLSVELVSVRIFGKLD